VTPQVNGDKLRESTRSMFAERWIGLSSLTFQKARASCDGGDGDDNTNIKAPGKLMM
jgi:hypothetical protein